MVAARASSPRSTTSPGIRAWRAAFDPAALATSPVTWTIGGLFEARVFFSNVILAQRAGVAIRMPPSRHFPQVSIPAILSAHIRDAAGA